MIQRYIVLRAFIPVHYSRRVFLALFLYNSSVCHFPNTLTPIITLPQYWGKYNIGGIFFLMAHGTLALIEVQFFAEPHPNAFACRVKWLGHHANWLHRVYWSIVIFSNLCFDNFFIFVYWICNRGISFCQFVTVKLQISSSYTIWKGDTLFWYAFFGKSSSNSNIPPRSSS